MSRSSTIDAGGNITYGDPQTRDAALQIAVAKFDSAITIATAQEDADLLNLARVGKARALLDLNQADAAATAAFDVPTSFQYLVRSSSNSPCPPEQRHLELHGEHVRVQRTRA